jgi:hypothetical protein
MRDRRIIDRIRPRISAQLIQRAFYQIRAGRIADVVNL